VAELSSHEIACLHRYEALLRERLGPELVEVVLFGSAARGDMWPPSSPMHSDIDVLVLTRSEVAEADQEELVNETYPLFLECGRQISPAFMSLARWAGRADRDRALREQVEQDGRSLVRGQLGRRRPRRAHPPGLGPRG
jgi:predicted nucleotidyltransferase